MMSDKFIQLKVWELGDDGYIESQSLAPSEPRKVPPEAFAILEAVLAGEYLKAWRLLMELSPEMKEKKQDTTCPTCGGTGYKLDTLRKPTYMKCPDCGGTGERKADGQ